MYVLIAQVHVVENPTTTLYMIMTMTVHIRGGGWWPAAIQNVLALSIIIPVTI